MIKQHTKAMDEIKRELQHERLLAQKQLSARPISIPAFVQVRSRSLFLLLSLIRIDL